MEQLNVIDFIEVTGLFEQKINLALNYVGLRIPHIKALGYLERSGKMTVSDLSRTLGVTRATTSVLVKQLITARLVETIDNTVDKRSHYLQVTKLGSQRLVLARQEVSLVEEKISRRLSDDLITTINHVTKLIMEEL